MDMVTYLMLKSLIQKSKGAASENFAPEYDPSKSYEAGDYAIIDGILYKYTGSQWIEANVGDALKELQNRKLNGNQGEENAGKFMVVNDDGNVVPMEGGGGTVIIDHTLSIRGAAADAKATGDSIAKERKRTDALYKLTQGRLWDTEIGDSPAYIQDVEDSGILADVNKIGGKTVVWNQMVGATKQIPESGEVYSKAVQENSAAAEIISIGGRTVKQNQMVPNGNFASNDNWVVFTSSAGTFTAADNIGIFTASASESSQQGFKQAFTLDKSHRYFAHVELRRTAYCAIYGALSPDSINANRVCSFTSSATVGSWETAEAVLETLSAGNNTGARFSSYGTRVPEGESFSVRNFMVFDLTELFGASYSKSDVAEVKADLADIGITLDSYISTSATALVHAAVTSVVSKDGGAETLGALEIPAAVRALEGYGQSEIGGSGNTLDLSAGTYTEIGHYVDGVWTLLDAPEVTDVSALLPVNMLTVEPGGSLTFEQDGTKIPVPTSLNWTKTAWTEALDSTHKYIYFEDGTETYISGAESQAIAGTDRGLIDLTRMFGAGSEPANLTEKQSRYVLDYRAENPEKNAGKLLSATVTDIVSKHKTAVWNQQIGPTDWNSGRHNGVTFTTSPDGGISLSGSAVAVAYKISTRIPVVHNGDKILIFGINNGSSDSYYLRLLPNTGTGVIAYGPTIGTYGFNNINSFRIYVANDYTFTDSVTVYPRVVNLTQMFGAGNEPSSTSDPRIAAIITYAEAHPEYNAEQTIGQTTVDGQIVFVTDPVIDEVEIPISIRSLEGYGESDVGGIANMLDIAAKTFTENGHYVDGEWVALDTPVVTNVSSYISADNSLEVETGGTVTFIQSNDLKLEIPNEVEYLVKLEEVVGA